MTNPTQAQLDRAAALIKATAADERRIPELGRLIDAATLVANADAAAWNDAVRFEKYPDQLANIPRLIRRNPDMKQGVLTRYRLLLADMISPVPGIPPPQVNFHTLAPPAKPFLLPAFLKLAVNGVYPMLDLDRSDLARGVLTYTATSGIFDRPAWMAQLEHASAWLGGTYQITASTSTTITLAQHTPLPAVIPFDAAHLKRGHVFYGFDLATRAPIHVPLAAITHTLTAGQSGSGKSVFLNQVLLSLLFNIDLLDGLTLVDLKGGVELGRYAAVHPKIRVITDYDALPSVAAELVVTMRNRLAQLRASGQRAATTNFHFLVIDEYAAIQFQTFADKEGKHPVSAARGAVFRRLG